MKENLATHSPSPHSLTPQSQKKSTKKTSKNKPPTNPAKDIATNLAKQKNAKSTNQKSTTNIKSNRPNHTAPNDTNSKKIDSATLQNLQNAIPSEIISVFEATDYNRTIALCTAFLSENPSAPQVWFVCGMSLYYLANIPRAIESLQIALTLAPNDEKIAFNLAEILRQNGNALAAIEILSSFVPCQNGDVYYNLARALTTQAESLNAQKLMQASNSPTMKNLQNLTTSQNRKSAQNLTMQSNKQKNNPANDLSDSISLDTLTNPQYFINPYEPQVKPDPKSNLLLAQAKQAYKVAIELNPNDKDAIYNLANLHAKDSEYSEAIALYQVCGTLNAKLNLAFLYNQIDEGKKACEIYAELESGFAKECGFLPLSMEGKEFDKDALDSYFRSNILPNMPKKRTQKHISSIQQFDEATLEKIATYKSHIQESSTPQKHISQFYFNYANTARYAGFNMLSFYLYGCAYCLDANPLCAINYAHLALSLQNFSLGFKLYEERLALEKADVFNADFFASSKYLHSLSGDPNQLQTMLKGKKVLIFSEQGFGDMIMFGRFIDALKRVCECKVYLCVRDELKGLFRLRYNVVERDFCEFDYCVSAMSLAYILEVKSLQDFSQNESYLAGYLGNKARGFANNDFVSSNFTGRDFVSEYLPKSTDNKDFNSAHFTNGVNSANDTNQANEANKAFKIGFFFASTSGSSNAKDKSIPLDFILPSLLRVQHLLSNDTQHNLQQHFTKNTKIELHCLQPESLLQSQAQENINQIKNNALNAKSSANLHKKNNNHNIRFYDLHSFLDTAKVMSGLDIIVSIDSAPAHLAIALGVPCLVIAHKRYDWRWEEIGKNITLQKEAQDSKANFSGLCGGEVLAQGRNGDWSQVCGALESYLVDFAKRSKN